MVPCQVQMYGRPNQKLRSSAKPFLNTSAWTQLTSIATYNLSLLVMQSSIQEDSCSLSSPLLWNCLKIFSRARLVSPQDITRFYLLIFAQTKHAAATMGVQHYPPQTGQFDGRVMHGFIALFAESLSVSPSYGKNPGYRPWKSLMQFISGLMRHLSMGHWLSSRRPSPILCN